MAEKKAVIPFWRKLPGGKRDARERALRAGRDWFTAKTVSSAIRSELVPAAIALGWEPAPRRPRRKGNRRLGEFEFERRGVDRLATIGFDFQFGEQPDVWILVSLIAGDGDGNVVFHGGNCADYAKQNRSFWRALIEDWRKPEPADRMGFAIGSGLRRLHIVEDFMKGGGAHPDLLIRHWTLGQHEWPEGYRMTPSGFRRVAER